MTSTSVLSALLASTAGPNTCTTVFESVQGAARRRARFSIRILSGACVVLGSLFLLSGCGEDVKTGTTVEVDQSKVKSEQEKMKEAMEKAHSRPTGGPKAQ